MVTTTSEVTERIADFVRRLLSAIPVERVILFGSHARGDAHEASDIDLAVISPVFDGKSVWERQEIIATATIGRGYRISPIGFASDETDDPGFFLREVLRTGQVVYPA